MSECDEKGHVYMGPVNGTADLDKGAPLYECFRCGEPGWDTQALTPVQSALLEEIKIFLDKNGYPPSIKDLCEAMRFASTSSAAHQLKNLERKGYIRRDAGTARAITLTEAGWQS